MVYPRKTVACILAVAMTASVVLTCGCGKKTKGSNEVVSADSTWYNMEKYVLEFDHDADLYSGLYPDPLGEAGDYLVVESTGMIKTGPDVDMMTLSFVEYYAQLLDVYDKNGNLVNSIDVIDLLSDSVVVDDYLEYINEPDPEEDQEEIDVSDALSSFWSGGICIAGDQIKVTVSFDGRSYNSVIEYSAYIDPATSAVTFERDSEEKSNISNEGVESIGSYKVEKIWVHDNNFEKSSYVINIYDDAGLLNSIDLSLKLPDEEIMTIDAILGIDDHTLLIQYFAPTGYAEFLIMDIYTGRVRIDEEGEYDWLQTAAIHETTYIEGFGSVVLDDEGIKTIDYENKTLTTAFSFDSCNINRGDVARLKLVSYSEEEIVFIGSLYQGNMFNSSWSTPQLIVLNKADSNPNAGKTVLTAATVGNIDYAMSEAVCVFNHTNPDYFIRFDYSYKADNHVDVSALDYSDENAYTNAYNEATIELSNQLTVDLMAGDGPDIIFDAAGMSQLNNEDYLIDLSDRINTDGIFANVVEAAKTDDKLYQVPLTFGVTGIAVLNEDIASGQTGFTFDQYASFVSSVCNGQNPLAMDQTEFFTMCMDAMGDQFITGDGDVDYDNEAFRALAEYTSEYVFAPVVIEADGIEFVSTGLNNDPLLDKGAIRIDSTSFDMYVALLGNHTDESTILGIPSIDARGPMLSITSSVAISAQTAEEDACWNFVETLLSSDVQGYYAQSSKGSPVLVSAFDAFAEAIIDDYNRAVTVDRNRMSYEAMELYGSHTTELDYSAIDDYKAMIASCSTISTTDTAISVIIKEEMPAYFSGQKTIDEVIDIIENRVQLFLNERG